MHYHPLIHTPKKKELEQIPLYIEAIPLPEKEDKAEEKEEPRVVIIELF